MSVFDVELRAATLDGRTLRGHAAVFDRPTRIRDHWEAIAPGAFDAVLADPALDVRALWNHDPAALLGRTTAGTLRLAADADGLRFEVDLPDTAAGRDVAELVGRGDVTGASFGFVPGRHGWSTRSDGSRLQTHTAVAALRDVSPVTYPAYETTDVALRSERPPPARLARARARLILGGANVP